MGFGEVKRLDFRKIAASPDQSLKRDDEITLDLFERRIAQKADYILINRFSGQIRSKLTSVDAN